MEPAIRVENIGKLYRVAQNRDKVKYHTLRDTLVDYVKAPFRRLKQAGMSGDLQDFWALKDVSFEVQPGEVVGIIGRNGAGKSTLLKILSRITKPTTGRIEINGRVGSLLEVGTGFHPELTGRENIYLNGSILGMSRAEIKAQFDEIVDFSGVEQFLDTPVKRYSSGMYVRLAFAVAAHLQPEILIVDEVLAVGDAEFQKKCLGKMKDVAGQGRTVLFVSHNMAAVSQLCLTGVNLKSGVVQCKGSINDCIAIYMSGSIDRLADVDLSNTSDRDPRYTPVVQRIEILNNDTHSSRLKVGESIVFKITIGPNRPISNARIAIRIQNYLGLRVSTLHSYYQYHLPISIEKNSVIKCMLNNCRLAPGTYYIDLQIDDDWIPVDHITNCTSFEVEQCDTYGTRKFLPPHASIYYPEVSWVV